MGNGEFRPLYHGAAIGATLFETDTTFSFDAEYVEAQKRRIDANCETIDDRMQRYLGWLAIQPEQMRAMFDAFVDELNRGLCLHRDIGTISSKMCSFKMLDSFVKTLPTGNEQGTFYAIDFGGTHLRAVRLHLQGNGKLDVSQFRTSLVDGSRKHVKGLMDANATATELFDHFAVTVKQFMLENGDLNMDREPYNVGFTFSFPCNMRRIDSASLVEWTKNFETGRATDDKVEGSDVCDLLQAAFLRNGVPAKVCAVMNDTVGTLLSCGYELDHSKHPKARVGVILGTGMNACYYDETCQYFHYSGNIVNIECGNFNRALPRFNVDMEMDFASANRGCQLLEKMVSGAYLGEICRRTIIKVFQSRAPDAAWNMHTMSAERAAQIATDDSPAYLLTASIIDEMWNDALDEESREYIRDICLAVFNRSAALSAVFIAACAHKTGYLQSAMGGLTVAVDGSLYKCNPFYKHSLRKHIVTLVGNERAQLLHLVAADDGSGKGAGVVAAQLVGA